MKRKTARAVTPNLGVERAYKRAMEKLIDEMSNSFEYWLAAAYKANPPRMEVAMDALPSAELSKKVRDLGRRWIKKFDDMAAAIAQKFTESGRKATDSSFQQALKDAGFAVEFKVTPVMRDAMNATIAENVSLIKSIPSQYFTKIEGDVSRGFLAGRDLEAIASELRGTGESTVKRAALIARDQSNKLTAHMNSARQNELGIRYAYWKHSTVDKDPRVNHLRATRDKWIFDTQVGIDFGDSFGFVLPGVAINCRCGSRSIIPAIDEDLGPDDLVPVPGFPGGFKRKQ